MRDIVVLLGPRLQGARRAGALAVYHQYGKARPGDGANTMWMAELALLYGAITRDADVVAQNSKLISDEIKITKGDGIQSDASYHQHSARLQPFPWHTACLTAVNTLMSSGPNTSGAIACTVARATPPRVPAAGEGRM